jgi:pyruvate/2-oxoglutarate dehydrogenase complex dihydrolipoamide dehydrogenase (E3) component
MIEPRDALNELLLSNVHPPDWKNPSPKPLYDLVVIGAGTAGLIAASGAAGLGAKVALIEARLMGGDCLNVGCVPSKSLLRSAHLAAEIRDAGRFGIDVPDGVTVDFPSVMRRMRQIRADISPVDSARRYQDELGIDVFFGQGRFENAREVVVGEDKLRFKRAIIATGARAATPPVPGLAEAGYLTNETVFELEELPKRLLVVGGGPIGCELAQAFSRFGSNVTLVEMDPRFLGRVDPDAAEVVRAALERDGVGIRLDTRLAGVELRDGERVATLQSGMDESEQPKTEELAADAILVGVGRAPNVEGLGLDLAGIAFNKQQGVQVDDRLCTTNSRVYAAGDICMAAKFTHAADFAARSVIQNAFFFGRKRLSALSIPWCTYTSPELAHVGLDEREAAARGIAIDTFTRELAEVDRARADGDAEGFVKIHTKKGTDQIVGATIVARHAGDLISEIHVAMTAGMGLGRLSAVIHPYPTQAEAIRQIGDQYNRTRLTPTVAKLFAALIRHRR